MKKYVLPKLDFDYGDLEPHISEQQLRIHHEKHHQGYVNKSNAIIEKLQEARQQDTEVDMKSTLKALSFNLGGHILHTLFWGNLTPAERAHKEPVGAIASAIEEEFGSFERFREEFSATANTTEGSGWGALAYDKSTDRLVLMQIEKHNVHIYPALEILMVIDVWEHAYYLDYKNKRGDFVEAFWNIVDWDEVNRRFERVSK